MVIIVSGKQGSGKTTTTKMLVEKHNGHHIKFADPLYEMHEAVWNILDGYGVPREKKSGDLLQYLGTEFGRKRDENIWVNIAKRRIAKILEENPEAVVIVDDCRFSNEFRELDGFNPIKVRLECDRDVRKARTDGWRDNEYHKSETDLDHIASDGEFDVYFDTETQSLNEVVSGIETAITDKEIMGYTWDSPNSFSSICTKLYDKGFKMVDGRSVGAW